MSFLKWTPLLALPALLACGGGGEAPFLLTPETPTVAVGQTLRLRAEPLVDLGGELEWEIQEPYGGGFLRSRGFEVSYVAPEAAGTYHLILRAPSASGKPLKHTFAIQVGGTSSVEPARVRVAPGGSAGFTATFRGLGRTATRWKVLEPGGGQITQEGRYLAPERAGTFHVVATSATDPQVSAQATVVVEP